MTAGVPAPGVLFVCQGNICRSPTAEYVARAVFAERGLALPVASRGMGNWHVGHGADPRAIDVARAAGFDLSPHRAQQFHDMDFAGFATILAVDRMTLDELLGHAPKGAPRPQRFLVAAGLAPASAGAAGDVPDPYTGQRADFERVLALIQRGVSALATALAKPPASAEAVRAPR